MSGVNEIRSNFLQFFARNGHEARAVEFARAAQRPDADVHQRRHGAVQERLHRRREAPLSSAPRRRRNACAPAASTTTSTMSAIPRATTPSSRCSAISRSAIISRTHAIEFAWNLLTRDFGLPKDRLTVTVYHDDDDAFELWKQDRRPARGAASSASPRATISGRWATPARAGRARRSSTITATISPAARPARPDADGDRFIEIWNLVFMQFETLPGGERINLPRPSIDTGMGLERIAAVLQGVHDNYDIDLFARADPRQRRPDRRRSRRAAARSRTASSPTICARPSFLVADGVLPSNEGRGYVLRRIMRRAMRHAQLLGARDPLMWRLVPALVREMGQAYPELDPRRGADRRDAEARGDALPRDAGARPLHSRGRDARARRRAACSPARRRSSSTTPYGFPLDLTQDALRARGLSVDTRRLRRRDGAPARRGAHAPGRARARPRPKRSGTRLRERVGATEFLGYETETRRGRRPRDRQGRRRGRAAGAGEKGVADPQPDAVLRRIRRPGRRRRRDLRARLPRRGDRHAQEARRSLRP